MFKTKLFLSAVTALILAACSQSGGEKDFFATIGTGGVTGVYYPTGGSIAKMLNQKKEQYNIRASAESTAGSVFNINALMSGDLEFGIAQSDTQYQAWNGQGEWTEKGAQKDLRSVFSIHAEALTLVAAEDSGIKTLADLKGKRVNIATPGSGQMRNVIDVLKTAGLDSEKDIKAEFLKPSEGPKMLQDNRIDAFFYTVGHPSGAITEATSGNRKVRFVPITEMDALIASNPYYSKTTIPQGLYPQASNQEAVETIGVRATLVTNKEVPEKVVYAFTKEIFENLEEFKKNHPAYHSLDRESMVLALSAPFHKGAEKYFKEVGLK